MKELKVAITTCRHCRYWTRHLGDTGFCPMVDWTTGQKATVINKRLIAITAGDQFCGRGIKERK